MAFSFGKSYKPRKAVKRTPPDSLEPFRPNRFQKLVLRVVGFFNRKRKRSPSSEPRLLDYQPSKQFHKSSSTTTVKNVSVQAIVTSDGACTSTMLKKVQGSVDYRAVEQFYTLKGTIGEGSFCKVKKAVHNSTQEPVAIKIIRKEAVGNELPRINKEIDALSRLDHPYICKLYQVIETNDTVFIVMELCSGGELFDVIRQKRWVHEEIGRKIFRQLVAAVQYVHEKGITHRDLKPENVLLDEFEDVKLIDFNLCSTSNAKYLRTHCGTMEYAAPELIFGDVTYDGRKTDAWSLGVFLYVLLCGSQPFKEPNIVEDILNCEYTKPQWLSAESLDLMDKLLVVEPRSRLSLENILNHPWLNCKVLKSGSKESIGLGSIQKHVKVAIPPLAISEGYNRDELDEEILSLMSSRLNLEIDTMRSSILSFKFDNNIVATYLLLLQKKRALYQPAFDKKISGWKPKKTESNRSLVSSISPVAETQDNQVNEEPAELV